MKNILLTIFLLLGVMFISQAQDVNDTTNLDPIFVNNPYLYTNVYADPWAKTKLLQQDYETFNRVWDYQRKQTREMCIGLGLGAVAIGGMVYAVNMPTPTRQVNNPDLDDEADKARRDRRIVGASSIALGAISGVIFARSFRWHRRIKTEVGLQSLRLEFNLMGNRRYFDKTGKHPKKLKKLRHHWRD